MSEFLTVTDRAYTAPAAADPIALPHPGVAYGNGAWYEILAAAPTGGAYLTEVCILPLVYSAYSYPQEVDIGVGSAGNETVISTFKLHAAVTNKAGDNFDTPLPVWVDAIPSGARVSVRLRAARPTAGTNTLLVSLSYVPKPISGERLSTTKPYRPYPPNTTPPVLVAGATDWQNGAWVELIATTLADWLLMAAWVASTSTNDPIAIGIFEVGVGAAGSEEVIYTCKYGGWHLGTYHPRPFYSGGWVFSEVIPAGSRLAMRIRGALDPGESTNYAWVHYIEAPL